MPKNMGTIDRIVRVILAAVVAVLFFTGQISGVAAIILGVIAVIFVLTSLVSFCPLYFPFKISTAKKKA
ncbi:MAG: DUF2892 domain-containing protein [Spirochaetota bacterium]